VGKSKLLERIYGNLPPRFGKSKETMYNLKVKNFKNIRKEITLVDFLKK
jgi:hypothetical protein